MNKYLPVVLSALLLSACSVGKKISREAKQNILQSPAFSGAHTGISIFDPASNKFLYNHQADKYFVPASNTKIATCYAVMKYLGDSLKGLRYDDTNENVTIVEATGDPTLLHSDFIQHPVFDFLKNKKHILINTENWRTTSLGKGWSWDDFNDPYAAERSPMPLYGNLVQFQLVDDNKLVTLPRLFQDSIIKEESTNPIGDVKRLLNHNQFQLIETEDSFASKSIPFLTKEFDLTRKLLRDTLKADVRTSFYTLSRNKFIYSQPTDSVLKRMMFRSDNFYAEQLLLMASNEVLGEMNEEQFIGQLLTTDFKDLPQKPRWVDGSGLSRYNMFTPQDFIAILNKIKAEQKEDRIKTIFPTGGQGSLQNYYVGDSAFIYAKTGGMSGVVCLSGYLYTKKNKLLLFSVLVNNHQSSASDVRRAIEQFLTRVRKLY